MSFLRPTHVTALALLALLAAVPSARAGCGDYVVHGTSVPVEQAARSRPAAPPRDALPPCHGPGCSQGKPALPPPAAPAPVAAEEWAWTGPPDTCDTAARHPDRAHEPRVVPRRPATSIYHPPRAADRTLCA